MFSFSKPTVNIGLEITEITWNWDFYLCLSGNKQSLNWLGLHIESFFSAKIFKTQNLIVHKVSSISWRNWKKCTQPEIARNNDAKNIISSFYSGKMGEMQWVYKLIFLSWWSSWWSQLWSVGAIIVSWLNCLLYQKKGGH